MRSLHALRLVEMTKEGVVEMTILLNHNLFVVDDVDTFFQALDGFAAIEGLTYEATVEGIDFDIAFFWGLDGADGGSGYNTLKTLLVVITTIGEGEVGRLVGAIVEDDALVATALALTVASLIGPFPYCVAFVVFAQFLTVYTRP